MEVKVQFEELSDEVCRHLLASEEVGRLAFIDVDGGPVVFPLNYALEGDLIVVRTDSEGVVDAVAAHPVAFEVEHLAPAHHGGWSVLVQGVGRDLGVARRPDDVEQRRGTVKPWAPGSKNRLLGIEIVHVSGRRIVPAAGRKEVSHDTGGRGEAR
jgi:hypothetical protein